MRKVLLAVTILLVACVQAARAQAVPSAAPADEYFGPYQQSVLEIRNRLDDYDRRDVSAMLDPSVPTYLDHLQLAVRDWQAKYPRDPWLPATIAHLVREYWRAGQASSAGGMSALADLRSTYPDSPITAQTVALIYGSNGELARVSNDNSSVDTGDGAQVASALPPYATPDTPGDVAPPTDVAPSPYESQPVEQAPVPEYQPAAEPVMQQSGPPMIEDAPPAEQAPPAEEAPPPEEHASAASGHADTAYDSARGYDPVHGYDAARGYDVARGYHVSNSYDASRGYDAWRGYDASRGYNAGSSSSVPTQTAASNPGGPHN